MKTLEDLGKQQDKMSIFRDFNQLKQYIVTVRDLLNAMSLYLTDEQKLEVIKMPYFQEQSHYAKKTAVQSIKDEKVKNEIIHDLPFMKSIFDKYDFNEFFKTVNETGKTYVLNNSEILEAFNFSKYSICELIKELKNDEIKIQLAKKYELSQFDIVDIIKTFSDENKKEMILENKEGLKDGEISDLISSLGTEVAIDFINNQQEFLASKELKPYYVIKRMSAEQQLQLIERIDEIQVTEPEKRRIFASLRNEAKKEIDLEKIDEKYRNLIGLDVLEKFENYGKIIPKLDGDMSRYADLDELLSINPLQIAKSDEQRQKLGELCKICPNATIMDNLLIGDSTTEEYIKGEEWINSVLQEIQEEWTDVQKLAYIDTMIGKRISYTPEFGTEVQNHSDARALWKIITNGYGICNGIAQIEQYLLGRVGIEAEMVSGKHHSFVKVKNIQIPTENGIIQGDTLVDPTWNLTASRYGCRPQHFCKSYDELRKVDFDSKGLDHECHKNQDLAEAITINMDVQNLREVYKSIGITDKEGNFPILQLIEQARKIDENSTDMQSNINSKFALLKKWCPEFATCQNSTIDVIKDILFENNEHFNFKRCISSKVYEREEANKQAVLYIYMEQGDGKKQFFYADKQVGEFISMTQDQFERKFECYETDLKKLPGNKRPWETDAEIDIKKENSSGEIVAEEGR